jgi:conflict system pore-forming effector with SLATT domain/uncharacterized protein DUF4231
MQTQLPVGDDAMTIETAWDEYRGWSERARELQSSAQRWNKAALVSASAAAVLGAAAAQMGGDPTVGKTLSLLAAMAAALTPILGKEILSMGSEAKWTRARATAEAIKSECFRFAARAGDYAKPDGEDAFIARRNDLALNAAKDGLSPKSAPAGPQGDKRRPPETLDAAWYIPSRIDDQILYYSTKQSEHERAAKLLRYLAFGSSAAAALFGVAGLVDQQVFAPWIGAMTTITTSIAAFGLLDRREHLAATFGAMATSLGRIKERGASIAFVELVTRAEDLMQSEHAAWTEVMTRTTSKPPSADGRGDS